MLLQNKDQTNAPDNQRRFLLPATLLLLLLLAAACAVGALFLKYRMEHVRSFSASAVRARVGMDFGIEALHTEGLRTLRADGLRMAMPVPGLGHVALSVDTLQVTLSLPDLIFGQAVAGRASVTGGRLVVEADARTDTRTELPRTGAIRPERLLAALPALAVVGNDCVVEWHASPDTPPVVFEDISFDFSNRTDTRETSLALTAVPKTGEDTGALSIAASYRLPDMLDITVALDDITTAHLAPFMEVPASLEGHVSGRVHAFGMLENKVVTEATVTVRDATIPGVPEDFERLGGEIRALVQWDAVANRLALLQGTVTTDYFEVTARGDLDLSQQPVVLDATATVGAVAFEELMVALLPEELNRHGTLEVDVAPGAEATVRAWGPLDDLETEAHCFVPSMTLAFAPSDTTMPKGSARIEKARFIWDDFSKMPRGTANVVDGGVHAEAFNVSVDALAGVVVLDDAGVSLRPITARADGKPWSGVITYKMEKGELHFDVNGALTGIEETPLYNITDKLWLGGDIAVHGKGIYGPDGRLRLNASADVTRGMVQFEWWLRKPVGVGASIHHIEVDMIPGRTLDVQGEASIEDTRIQAKLEYIHTGERFQSQHIRVDIPHLEINSAGKCIQIPYTVLGTVCRDGYYESNPAGDNIEDSIAVIGGYFEEVFFWPEGGENPLVCRDAEVKVTLTDIENVERSAKLEVHVGDAHVPPFGDDWLLHIGPTDPEYIEQFPSEPQPWTYKLSADRLAVPPWEGNNFSAEVFSDEQETRFNFFRADVGNGRIEGKHRHTKEDNLMRIEARWDGIPAKYLIRHLELPEILVGEITGDVAYQVEQDAPETTLDAKGQFTVVDGHFIPEQLALMFADTLGSSFIALHPDALRFKEMSSQVRIEGDHIHTSDVVIDSAGMRITGNGVWVTEGDLDYRVDLAVKPDLAEQIPILRDNFNVQGFRMTQQDIELGFHLTGPTVQPTGELAGLPPIGVTIVSGAAEMTGEAIRLLDTPRQMFMSIFRIGGGILGATRTQQKQQQQQREAQQ